MDSAKIILDSVNPEGDRITTFVLDYPRYIHSELLTHRAFSRNSASSRAIPIKRMIADIRENPAVPARWGANQKGMQSYEEMPLDKKHAGSWHLDKLPRYGDCKLRRTVRTRAAQAVGKPRN